MAAKPMKSMVSVRVAGMSRLQSVPGGIDKAQKVWLDNAGKRFRDSLAANTPRRSGRLQRNWRYEVVRGTDLRFVNDLPYAKAIDRGAYITPKRGQFLRFQASGRDVFVRFVRLQPANIGKKGLRGRGRIMNDEFAKAMDRIELAS